MPAAVDTSMSRTPKDPKDERDELLRDLYAKSKEFRGLAIAWFTPASWARMREAAADRDNLPVDFETFERLAGDRLADMIAKGHPAERMVLNVDNVENLIYLCRMSGQPLDARARARFAMFMLAHRDAEAGKA
jgi:hypothetical protein